MSYHYRILVQFAMPGAPAFGDVMPVIDRGIINYNAHFHRPRSPRKNRKIVGKSLVDPYTLQLDLESGAELRAPSKAFRPFSSYLVSAKTVGNLSALDYCGHLLKTAPAEPDMAPQIRS